MVCAPDHLAAQAGIEVLRHGGNAGSEAGRPIRAGTVSRVDGVARTLRAIGGQGREGFYAGKCGERFVRVGGGEPTEARIVLADAVWVPPLAIAAFRERVCS